MTQLNDLLRDVPEGSHRQVVERAVESAWKSHRQNLSIMRDVGNPLRQEAVNELVAHKKLAQQALNTDLLNGSTFLATARMLAAIDIDSAGIKQDWCKPGRVVVRTYK